MKLAIKNISKKYGTDFILNNVSYCFDNKGFYCICGDSGCGKSTLLNILSLIIPPEKGGEVIYDSCDCLAKNDEERKDFRLKNTGYIFQSFNLFNNDTVFNNLLLLVDAISSFSYEQKRRKIDEVLKRVDIFSLKYKNVQDLSGGEKQRVAIARALINNPRVIFADEPTGSLDEINSNNIFQILKNISKTCLIICVTHDVDLANKYSNFILRIENKKLIEQNFVKNNDEKTKNFMMIERKKKRNGYISDKFIFSHFASLMKIKKVRFAIATTLMTLALFSVGLSSYIKTGISENLSNSFSSIMNGNTLVVKNKNNSRELVDYYGASLSDVKSICNDYKSDIDYYGISYLANFEEFFIDQNSVYNVTKSNSLLMEGLNARSFNEFELVNDIQKEKIYPLINENLKNDEVIISCNYLFMKKLCLYLQIPRDFVSLGQYLANNVCKITLNLANDAWGYVDNIAFRIKGVAISTRTKILHTNNLFNEEIFEKTLQFPSSLNIQKKEKFPWVLKKVYFVKTNIFQSTFLNKIMIDEKYTNYIFDSDGFNYYPNTYKIEDNVNSNRVFVYLAVKNGVPYSLPLTLSKYNKLLKNYYYSTKFGYLNSGTDIFSGFSKHTFFSFNKEKINNVIDGASRVDINDLYKISEVEEVLSGSFLNTSERNVKFSTKASSLLVGRKPNTIQEIMISKKMAEELNNTKYKVNDDLYVSMVVNSVKNNENNRNYFRTIKLKVVGITNDEKVCIYQDSNFSISLFRDLFKISSFELIPNAIVYEMDNKVSNKFLDSLNKILIDYHFIDPLENIKLGIDETLIYLECILVALSIVSSFSSIFLMIIINYIDLVESKRDYAVLTVIGFKIKEIMKLQCINVIIPGLISFFGGSCALLATSRLLSDIISNTIGQSTPIYYDIKPFIFMFLVMVVIIFFSSIFSYRPIKRINLIKELH